MLITLKEQKKIVRRNADSGLYHKVYEPSRSRSDDMVPIEDATLYDGPLSGALEEAGYVAVTVRTYYIVDHLGENNVPPV